MVTQVTVNFLGSCHIPVPAKELFFLAMYFKGFSHGEIFVIVQTLWILHRQLTVKPFYGHGAILDINAYYQVVRMSPMNTSALCRSMTWFLSSSGNRIAQRTTMSFVVHDLVSVITLQLFATGQGLQCLGRHLRDIKVMVDPGSKRTLWYVTVLLWDGVTHHDAQRCKPPFIGQCGHDVL